MLCCKEFKLKKKYIIKLVVLECNMIDGYWLKLVVFGIFWLICILFNFDVSYGIG